MISQDVPLFSIIIPMYNVEKYAEDCLNSIISQVCDDYEAIVVDDGSTDCTPSIVDRFAQLYPDRIVVIHSVNQGLVAARQLGLSKARGDYVIPIDGDDWIDKTYLQQFQSVITNNPNCCPDILGCGIRKVYKDHTTDSKQLFIGLFHDQEWEEIKFDYLFSLNTNLCSKCIKRELYSRYQNPINPMIKMGEDGVVMYPLYAASNCVYFVNDCLYYYRQVTSSMSHSKVKYIPWEQMTWRTNYLFDCLGEIPSYKEMVVSYAVHAGFNSALSIFKKMGFNKGREYLIKCLDDSSYDKQITIESKYLTPSERIAKFILERRLLGVLWLISNFR